MSDNGMTSIKIKKIVSDQWNEINDALAVEEPLEIQLQLGEKNPAKSIAVTMRTPGNDLELAVGFLFTEGIIKNVDAIKGHKLDGSSNKAVIILSDDAKPSLINADRNFYATSSCGVCGKASIEAIKSVSAFNIHLDEARIEIETLYGLGKELQEKQAVFSKTGGLHASALFDCDGDFITLREDVGRHNALDKLIGASLLNETLPLSNKVLLLSGRASFELIQKASMAGISIVAAVGAPSSLAVNLAIESGITLIGFLRDNRFNIYCRPERVNAYVVA